MNTIEDVTHTANHTRTHKQALVQIFKTDDKERLDALTALGEQLSAEHLDALSGGTIWHQGKAIAAFNLDGSWYGIWNDCSNSGECDTAEAAERAAWQWASDITGLAAQWWR